MQFKPAAILIDGYDWEQGSPSVTGGFPLASIAGQLGGFKALAKRIGAELWVTAQTHRGITGNHPTKVTPPCAAYLELIDVAIFLEPHEDHVDLRLLKDHEEPNPPETHLHLHADTMRLVADDEQAPRPKLPANAFTLLSGAAAGAEAEFGACAERWGLAELNFTFVGRAVERQRGLVYLSDRELKQGDVSSAYLSKTMHRTYPDTPLFRKVLQSVWHQVNSAGEVFAIGVIQPDKTVKGGTGWAAELARHWQKSVHVFDQERKGWFVWKGPEGGAGGGATPAGGEWVAAKDPVITRSRFTGTGTRFLSSEGQAAIRGLFERSIGAPSRPLP
jgi:hypothetical protein